MEVEVSPSDDSALLPPADEAPSVDVASPMVTVRVEEAVLVALVLLLWGGAIALFFKSWGKIRMLEPYQPKFHQQPHRPSCPLGSPTASNTLPRAPKGITQRMSFSKYNVNALTDPLSILPSPIIKRPRRSSVFVGSALILNGAPRRAKSATDIHYVGAMDPRSSTSLTSSVVPIINRRPSLAGDRPIFISRRRPSTTIERLHFVPKGRRASCFVGAHRPFNSFEAAASQPSGLAVPVKGRSCGRWAQPPQPPAHSNLTVFSFVNPIISFEMAARPKASRSFEQPGIIRAKPERLAVSLDVGSSFNSSRRCSMPGLPTQASPVLGTVYPALEPYMGLELSEEVIRLNMPEYRLAPSGGSAMVAPLSGQSLGLQKAQVTNAVRQVVLCKDKDNKIGLRLKEVNKGIFVALVVSQSPAALAGLRFGDQILQINGINMAGFSMEKAHDLLKKSAPEAIAMAIRDRPFERAITLHKDSTGCLGFQFKDQRICALVKDSSAARNGVLIDHQLLEVDGQNVIGLSDKQIRDIIQQAGNVVTITVMPRFIYQHMVKKMAGSLIKGLMDHSL
ncbi:hypothetical protein YQE_08439, partial [Dendroctonus ponderosae]